MSSGSSTVAVSTGGPPDIPRTVSVGIHRELMSVFPTGVAVVTTLDKLGRPWGLTCSSLVSVTLYPPTLLICIDTASVTLRAIRDSGVFAVNILRGSAQRAAEVFSSAVPDRFAQVAWQVPDDSSTPWLCQDALAYAECAVSRDLVVGDHAVVLGTVESVRQTPGLPLLHGMRRFTEWVDVAYARRESNGAPA